MAENRQLPAGRPQRANTNRPYAAFYVRPSTRLHDATGTGGQSSRPACQPSSAPPSPAERLERETRAAIESVPDQQLRSVPIAEAVVRLKQLAYLS